MSLMDAPPLSAAGLFELLNFHSQNRRLVKLETAFGSTLVAERMRIREAVNEPFELTVDALSSSAHLELKPLVGEQMSVRLQCVQNGIDGYRPWHGYVFSAAQLGSDGGVARYRLVMRPWLSFLGLRSESRIFQDQTALATVEQVFRDCPGANFRIEVTEPLRVRSLCTQYRETSFDFISRLLAEEGLSYHFEHLDGDAAAGADKQGQARHVMVITDRGAARASLGPIRFAGASVMGIGEAIDKFSEQQNVQTNSVTLGSWNYKQLTGTAGQAAAEPQDNIGTLERYDGTGAYRYENIEHAERAADLRLAWHDLQRQRVQGSGTVGRLIPGSRFDLLDHASGNSNYTLVSVEHEAANNLGSEAAQLLAAPDMASGQYRNHFEAVPAELVIVPQPRIKPAVPGVQTALVVGVPTDALTTDRDLRVKVQFHWQRGALPNPGGLGHQTPSDTEGNAPGNERSGSWVRVAQPSAGANWGAVFVPRQGTEVLVDFVEGDIDRPLIVGQLHNGQDALPWPAGVDSGANHPGTLSGWQSETLDGEGLNQWVVDDATGQLRMRLASLSQGGPWSELSLGHIIGQGSRSSQRGAWLGSGFYAHTDGWATVRGAQGLLLSATSRAGTYGSAQSTQMDAQEAVAQLKGAQQLGQALDDAAQGQGALGLASHKKDAQEALEGLLKAIDPKQDGKYDDQRKANGREAGDPVERFDKPYVVLDTPSAAIITSPATIATFSGQDTSLTAQGDVHVAAAHTASLISGQTTSLYTHQGELQAIAANGDLSLRAHTDQLELLADKDITVVSVNNEITITAKQRIELVGGDSKVVLDGANIDFVTSGTFTVKAASHEWAGGASGSTNLEALPQGLAGQTPQVLELNHHWPDLTPMAGAPYRAVFADGSSRSGTLDAQGQARLEGIPSGLAEVFYGEDARPAVLKPVTLQTVTDDALAEDLRKLGLDPQTVNLQALVQRQAGRA